MFELTKQGGTMKRFLSDVLIPYELLGLESIMIPFFNFISTQRGSMAAKNAQQWVILDGAEFPRCFTAAESMYGDYTFDKLIVDRDVIVIKVIKKYGRYVAGYEVKNNEVYTVICEDVKTGEIGFFNISSYRFLSRGFGYFTKKHNRKLLVEGTRIPKGTVFQSSSAVDDNLYKMGVNANVIYLPLLPTTEDACVISESLAEKMAYTQFYQYVIRITENMIPLNIYGTSAGEHKFFPDIGECVGKDGLLAVLRPLKSIGVIKDYTEEKLKTYHPIYDEPFRCQPGAKVVDVDVYVNPKKWRDLDIFTDKKGKDTKEPSSVYSQIAKYQHQTYSFYDEVLKIYEENPDKPYSPKLTSLLAKYALLKPGKKSGRPNEFFLSKDHPIFDGENPIDIAYLKITVAVKKKAEIGTKITGRDGSKGVISAIWKDWMMPKDEQGFVAHLIMNSNAVVDRMNISQLFEQFFARLGDLVVMDTMHLPIEQAYQTLMEFLNDYDPLYREKVEECTSYRKEQWVNEVRARGIYFHVPTTRAHFGMDHSIFMANKWNHRISNVTFTYPLNRFTGETKTVTSYEPEEIGSKYVFLINKIPSNNAVEIGYVSQLGLAIKNSAAKARFIAQTAIRFGEDEGRVIQMGAESGVAARLFNVSGNSFEDTKEVVRLSLLTPNPLSFRCLPSSNAEIAGRSIPAKLLTHIMAAAGIDMSREAVFREDEVC